MATEPQRQLLQLHIGDDADAWSSAGFTVVDDSVDIAGVALHLHGSAGQRGILGWTLDGVDEPIDGLAILEGDSRAAGTAAHPNGVESIDHLVVGTTDFGRTVPALEQAGIELRRTRTFNLGDDERQQCFFWLGTVILELIGPATAEPDAHGPATFWGLALTAPDLDATAGVLGERASVPKPAIQKGRQISTLRTRDLDISLPIAIMSPHVG
jgi:hypothetical protein